MINRSLADSSWLLYLECEVLYDGRAASHLARGNYLIIFKPDHCLSIHGSTLIKPRNYLGVGTTFTTTDNLLSFSCGSEKIIIKYYQPLQPLFLDNWSDAKATVYGTEQEIATQIFNSWFDYFPDSLVELLYNEYPTELGPIDVFGRTPTTDIVIEVKRRRGFVKDVTQLRRYLEALDPSRPAAGYLACPSLSRTAAAYLQKHGLHHLPITIIKPALTAGV